MRAFRRTIARRAARRRGAVVAFVAAVGVVVTGCTAGADFVVPNGGTFAFVSPDGGRDFSYLPADRQPLAPLSGPDLADEASTLQVSDHRGRVVVLNLWATWCAQCRVETPDLVTAAATLDPQQVQFLGINVRDSRSDGRDFVAGKQVPYPSIFDPSMRTVQSIRGYPATGIPSTIVLDREGRVAQIWLRAVTSTELVAAVSAIATE